MPRELSVEAAEGVGFNLDLQVLQLSFKSHLKLLSSATFLRHYKRRH